MKKLVLATLCACLFSACQTVYVPKAREVKKKPRSNGIIAMPTSYRPEDRQRAEELMKQNCSPLSVSIVDEGEAVVGQETKSNMNTTNRDDSRSNVGNLFGIPVVAGSAGGTDSQASSVTTQIKEWQVSYNCEAEKSAKAKR